MQPPQAGFRRVYFGPDLVWFPGLNSLWQLRCMKFCHREYLLVNFFPRRNSIVELQDYSKVQVKAWQMQMISRGTSEVHLGSRLVHECSYAFHLSLSPKLTQLGHTKCLLQGYLTCSLDPLTVFTRSLTRTVRED